jgi:hypothetical protein
VSTDRPDLAEPHDPALDGLFRALTAGGTAEELAGRPAALEMFRASRPRPPARLRPQPPARLRPQPPARLRPHRLRPSRFRPHRLRASRFRLAVSMSSAAAALVLVGGLAAAYAAALPAPAQHIAYQMLGRIGVPDAHRPTSSASAPRPAVSIAPTPSAPALGCPCPTGRSGAGAVPDLTLTAAQAQIRADGPDVLSGRLASGGRPEADVRVRLFEHVAGRPGWRAAGSAVTDGSGEVTLTVAHLTRNASFRLAARGGVVSSPVLITVIPPVYLDLAPGPQPGLEVLTARARFAETGDVVELQERAGGIWYAVGQRVLGPDHQASFGALIPSSGDLEYRVVLLRTAAHGSAASGIVRIGARAGGAGRAKTSLRARPAVPPGS